ncbi:MAG: helix-turn-helix domain-containing protein [bacterium]
MRLMAEACLYISENCAKPLSLAEIAARIGISKSHFAHLFKAYTNMTFVDFLTAERIKMAESLFPNPKLHIIDIAFESGFSSISSFNRAFRRIKGCSPTEFRATMIT